MHHGEPFRFQTERRLVELTGVRARNLPELRTALTEVPGSSIFYHTHHNFLSRHFEKPVVHSDFSIWVGEALREDALAEKLAAVDLLAFTTIRELREAIVGVVDERLSNLQRPPRDCPPGDEFHFCRSKSFVMPTGLTANDVDEFFTRVAELSNMSLYFHFLEARLRLGRPTNDFSSWLEYRGEHEAAQMIDRLDPYASTLEEIKEQILEIGRLRSGRRA